MNGRRRCRRQRELDIFHDTRAAAPCAAAPVSGRTWSVGRRWCQFFCPATAPDRTADGHVRGATLPSAGRGADRSTCPPGRPEGRAAREACAQTGSGMYGSASSGRVAIGSTGTRSDPQWPACFRDAPASASNRGFAARPAGHRLAAGWRLVDHQCPAPSLAVPAANVDGQARMARRGPFDVDGILRRSQHVRPSRRRVRCAGRFPSGPVTWQWRGCGAAGTARR
jgi:hypothetical protein